MVNVGFTFLYCVLSCIQMYILMAIGYISYYRKILNSKNNGLILYAYERMVVKCSSDGHHLCVDNLYSVVSHLTK